MNLVLFYFALHLSKMFFEVYLGVEMYHWALSHKLQTTVVVTIY